ncbi:hypothetical protein E0J21_15200 [Rhizobium laguerreae]|nr:hypothetical protein E0J21_15200 [Rhizobium laguerreae]
MVNVCSLILWLKVQIWDIQRFIRSAWTRSVAPDVLKKFDNITEQLTPPLPLREVMSPQSI